MTEGKRRMAGGEGNTASFFGGRMIKTALSESERRTRTVVKTSVLENRFHDGDNNSDALDASANSQICHSDVERITSISRKSLGHHPINWTSYVRALPVTVTKHTGIYAFLRGELARYV
jgi:hypothetical protein